MSSPRSHTTITYLTYTIIIILCVVLSAAALKFNYNLSHQSVTNVTNTSSPVATSSSIDETPSLPEIKTEPETQPAVERAPLPPAVTLENTYHIFQTFNNCGPASLSMTLSYYGIQVSQETLGQKLRPYQHSKGNNDDKSVTLEELADKASEYDLIAYYRPNGSIERLKYFLANGMPVIVRTLLHTDSDIAHYRVIKGYDDVTLELIQDDSYQEKNLRFSYDKFTRLWQASNFEYLVLVPPEKDAVVRVILGDDIDPQHAWSTILKETEHLVELNPDDPLARLNLSIALYYTNDFVRSVAEFEQVEEALPLRTLWYHIEPIQAYVALGDDERALTLIETVLTGGNRAYSELYLIRGNIYKKRGETVAAKKEFELAMRYNKHLKAAQTALASMEAQWSNSERK